MGEQTQVGNKMKCDELEQVENPIEWGLYYDKSEVDAAIAELKDDNEFLKKSIANGDVAFTVWIDKALEFKAKLDKAIAERDGNQVCIDALKQKLENVQASMYADVVDANMEVRRLRRALWIARAKMAFAEAKYNNQTARRYEEHKEHTIAKRFDVEVHQWENVKTKCLKKAEEYK